MEYKDKPTDLCDSANQTILTLLPTKSETLYKTAYQTFTKWRSEKEMSSSSERVILAYFMEISQKYKPSSLWAIYSMLKSTLMLNENVNIKQYDKLSSFLKNKSSGFKSEKSKVLSTKNIHDFLNKAPDEKFLATKVALIFGICGACRSQELTDVRLQHLTQEGNVLIVDIPHTRTSRPRTFTITQEFTVTVNKYRNLRPKNVHTDRFFLNFQNGKCTSQVIGRNKFAKMPSVVATFLGLENPELFTGHCFRRTAATLTPDSGASMRTLKIHGGRRSNSVAEGYTEKSIHNKTKISEIIVNSINQNSSGAIKSEATSENEEFFYDETSNSTDVNIGQCIDYSSKSNDDSKHILINQTSSESSSHLQNEQFLTLHGGLKFQNCNVTINYHYKNP